MDAVHYQLSVFSAQWKATNIITRSSLSQFSVLHCFSGFGFVSIVLFSSVFSIFLLVFLVHSSKLKCSCFLVLFGFIVVFIPKNCTLFFYTTFTSDSVPLFQHLTLSLCIVHFPLILFRCVISFPFLCEMLELVVLTFVWLCVLLFLLKAY